MALYHLTLRFIAEHVHRPYHNAFSQHYIRTHYDIDVVIAKNDELRCNHLRYILTLSYHCVTYMFSMHGMHACMAARMHVCVRACVCVHACVWMQIRRMIHEFRCMVSMITLLSLKINKATQ